MSTGIRIYRNFDQTGESLLVSEGTYKQAVFNEWGVTADKILIDSRVQEDTNDNTTKTKTYLGGTWEPELLNDPLDIYLNYQRFVNVIALAAESERVPLKFLSYLKLGFVPLVMHPWLQDSAHQELWVSNFALDYEKLAVLPQYIRRALPILSNRYMAPSYCQTDILVHRNDIEDKFGISADEVTLEQLWRKVWKT